MTLYGWELRYVFFYKFSNRYSKQEILVCIFLDCFKSIIRTRAEIDLCILNLTNDFIFYFILLKKW